MKLRLLLWCAVAVLSGCADYRAVSQFSSDTTSMTGVVRTEFAQLDALCVDQAELVIVVNGLPDDRPLAVCEQYRRTQARFAALTVGVLDDYAEALGELADDKPFDLTSDVRGVGTKVKALKDRTGDTVVSTGEANALIRISDLLVEALAMARRDDAARRMLQATPDLEVVGRSLRSFFVQAPDASAGTARAPYANFVAVVASSTASTQSLLQNPAMKKAEPIRTTELLRELRIRQVALDKRDANSVGSVPARIGAVIDAWLAAVDQFSTDAMKPDSREMRDRLTILREAIRTARADDTD